MQRIASSGHTFTALQTIPYWVTLHYLHRPQCTNLVAEFQATRRTAGTPVGETAGVSVHNHSLAW